MILWRITKARYAKAILSGEGARLYGTRWTRPGNAIISASPTLSLSALEYLVHLDVDLVSEDLVGVEIHVEDSAAILRVEVAALPKNWRTYPAPEALLDVGDAWHHEERYPLLSVPSAIIPHERNTLINPSHRDVAKLVRVAGIAPFAFDTRLL